MAYVDARREPTLRAWQISHNFVADSSQPNVLNDVSLDLFSGEIALLMGPSGSGKSTLLAALSGLLRPNTGTVQILGQDLWHMTEAEREACRLQHFGFVFQGYNLFPALTALQQLEIVLRWSRQISKADALVQANEMLDNLYLTKQKKLRPAQLSGGEKQRVAIGRALVKKPSFCFADEPTGALDWDNGQQVMELLQIAAKDLESTILVVGHDDRMIPYADRVYRLVDGYIRRDIEPKELLVVSG